ncbi:MAG TPA: putative metalloprotease CJM1_0395 family protein [Holophaga sp.]|nr:putative metalloprotease CJM1_0395 family protein [Holophaga sp.]
MDSACFQATSTLRRFPLIVQAARADKYAAMRIGALETPVALPSLAGGQQGTSTASGASSRTSGTDDSLELSQEAQGKLAKLKQRDREVRAHEAAHISAGGGLVRSGASYTYQEGPDGNRYAVGGEVQLDASPVANDPRATLAKAQQLRAAALAPATPSAQDQAVAASANAMAMQASMDLARQQGAAMQGASLGSNLDMTG